jgi:hypothetical protein
VHLEERRKYLIMKLSGDGKTLVPALIGGSFDRRDQSPVLVLESFRGLLKPSGMQQLSASDEEWG